MYVTGDEGPFGARHVGINAPHGIRIMAEKPQILGPFDRPHRMILQRRRHLQGLDRLGLLRVNATASTGRRKPH